MNNIERAKLIKKIISDRALDSLTKRLYLGSIISAAFKDEGFDIILVGGSAVEFYTAGGYMTGDADFHVYANADKERVMHELGFEGNSRNYSLGDQYIEFVSDKFSGNRNRVITQKCAYGYVKIIGLEDILLDRIAASGNHFEQVRKPSAEWAVSLMYSYFHEIDWKYVKDKTVEDGSRKEFKHLYFRVLELRRFNAYRDAANILGIEIGDSYPKEKDAELFALMKKSSLKLSSSEIRLALREYSPYISNDFEAYNLELSLIGKSPVVRKFSRDKKINVVAEDSIIKNAVHFTPEWLKLRDNLYQCEYPCGFIGMINWIREDLYMVSFGSSGVPSNKWKDITSRHGFISAVKWCNDHWLSKDPGFVIDGRGDMIVEVDHSWAESRIQKIRSGNCLGNKLSDKPVNPDGNGGPGGGRK